VKTKSHRGEFRSDAVYGANTKLGQRGFGPTIAIRNGDREVKTMTYIPNNAGMLSIEDSRRILRAIFPNYPDLTPCYPAPTLEPVAPSPVNADFEVVVA